MRPAEVSLMLKSARLAAGNPMALKGPSQPPSFFDAIEIADIAR